LQDAAGCSKKNLSSFLHKGATHPCIFTTKSELKKLPFILLLIVIGRTYAQNYPLPSVPDTANSGRYIQRTMHLLATSTPEKRNTVKILVYGQSISVQDWWLEVKRDLISRFPNADIIMENKAIGGFASQLLSKTVELDVSSFYPDLVLFHVYGSPDSYEMILKTIRSRTAAEIAIQTDHYTKDDKWSDNMSYKILPGFAEKYKCELIQVRREWKKYLDDNKYKPSKLLSDDVHLNAHGNFLMAELIKPYLHYKLHYKQDEFNLATTYVVGKDVFLKGSKIILPFKGNKVDVISGNTTPSGNLKIFVDNKKPSSFPGTYFMTRPYSTEGGGWPWTLPAMIHVGHTAPWLSEEWTCIFDDVSAPYEDFGFSISGSKTGPDGSGRGSKDFISKSKRVIIKKGDADAGGDWHLKRSHAVMKTVVKPGDVVKWKTYSISTDILSSKPGDFTSITNPVTLFQGIPNKEHVLKIRGKLKNATITEIRVYKPFLEDGTN
jgi:hypothetical protein